MGHEKNIISKLKDKLVRGMGYCCEEPGNVFFFWGGDVKDVRTLGQKKNLKHTVWREKLGVGWGDWG